MEVEAMVRPVVESAGLELVDVGFHREQGRRTLRVTVDRPPGEGGLDLETISLVSERISRRLDIEGFEPPGPYTLEVTSPGVERPLREPRDFERRIGQKVRVKTVQAIDGDRTVTGTIADAGVEEVRISTDRGDRVVRFDDISSARTVLDWGASPGREKGRHGGTGAGRGRPAGARDAKRVRR